MKKLLVVILFITGVWLVNSCKSLSQTDKFIFDPLLPSTPTQRNTNSEQNQKQRQITSQHQVTTFTNKKSACTLQNGAAVVLMYHRFDEEYDSTSIAVEKFHQHMQFFKDQGYSVVPISTIISAINGSIPFGDKWVTITVDDAYKSFLKVKPILEKFNYPYTIFVSTETVDQKNKNYMSWDDLKQIADSNLGELAAHSHTHAYLVRDFTAQERQRDILLSVKKIYENTGILSRFFAYPYGETSENLIEEVKNMQEIIDEENFYFLAAFSTQSGPVGCSSDLFSLPRFAMNEQYGIINDLFKTKVNSLHLPVYDVSPENKAICVSNSTNRLSFSTIANVDSNNLHCYGSRGNSVSVQVSKNRVTLKLKNALGAGVRNTADARERVNCTLRDRTTNRFFWYGQEFTILNNSRECSTRK